MEHARSGAPDRRFNPDSLADMRTVALIVGLLGALGAVLISMLYSLMHRLAALAGIAQDIPHFGFGLFVGVVGALGALLAPFSPRVAAALLAGAGVAFFFDVGWWAFLASPFLLAAATLAYRARHVDLPGGTV
jgi:hypothetical protein